MSGWDRNDPDEWGRCGQGCANGIILSGLTWLIIVGAALWWVSR